MIDEPQRPRRNAYHGPDRTSEIIPIQPDQFDQSPPALVPMIVVIHVTNLGLRMWRRSHDDIYQIPLLVER